MEKQLSNILEISRGLDDFVHLYDGKDWIPKMFTLFLANITLFFIGSILASWLNFQRPALSAMIGRVLIPVFTVLMTVASLTAIVFSSMSIMNAGKYQIIIIKNSVSIIINDVLCPFF